MALHVPEDEPLTDPKSGRVVSKRWKSFIDALARATFTIFTGTISLAQLVAHKTTHQSGGSDAIKLDDLAAADDTTDLDSTAARHGLLPKLSGDPGDVLHGDGTWAPP